MRRKPPHGWRPLAPPPRIVEEWPAESPAELKLKFNRLSAGFAIGLLRDLAAGVEPPQARDAALERMLGMYAVGRALARSASEDVR